MLPTINGKSFLDCSIKELKQILDNQDYRESEYVDYKKSFEISEIPKNNTDALNRAKAEFRKDVCAFANSQGGYLIYGIKEDGKAVPHVITGIPIAGKNTEAFENTVKNTLQTIKPRIPHIEIRFLEHGENYVVIIYIHHDFYTPYVFLENNQDYRIHRRVGNSTKVASYAEVKTMFMQAGSLEKEIEKFRKERIEYYRCVEASEHIAGGQYVLLHIFPDTYNDPSYNQPLFYIENKGAGFSTIFFEFECNGFAFPTVEGLRYPGRSIDAECRLYNNGVAECYYPLSERLQNQERFPWGWCWTIIENTVKRYLGKIPTCFRTNRFFVGISIIGCKNYIVEYDSLSDSPSRIDRDVLICSPQAIQRQGEQNALEKEIMRLKADYMLSLGIRSDSELSFLLDEVNKKVTTVTH